MCIPHCLTFPISLVSGHGTIQILLAMIGSNAEQELNLESPRKRIGVQNKKVYKGQQTSSISDQNCITEIQEIDSAPPLGFHTSKGKTDPYRLAIYLYYGQKAVVRIEDITSEEIEMKKKVFDKGVYFHQYYFIGTRKTY
ncbi:uncharacterized protein LOC126878849 isoform X1 [Diabrotica virgifera virgifera]|uniref:Uncharacterized protein n=1 Tax=Diabrotica virgifera virgifera TaxID=50390 RepID=A0ABM5JID0_DIAVI|nr:uncharacterized protein LOC126878849 isoform X1 [Diabrotica virgifera virgifera]